MEYAEKFSVTSQKLVLRLGLRPAPLAPDLASQTMPLARSITPACTRGRSARLAAGGDRKSTRLNSSHANLVCRLLLEKKADLKEVDIAAASGCVEEWRRYLRSHA